MSPKSRQIRGFSVANISNHDKKAYFRDTKMPKRIDKQELDKIAALLAPHKAGLGIAELGKACKTEGLDFDRRTLQRRLGELVKANRVLKEGVCLGHIPKRLHQPGCVVL